VDANTTAPHTKLATPNSGARTLAAAPFCVELAAAPLATEVTAPEPEVAVAELFVPAFCDPSPVRPGPVPAPLDMYCFAGSGIAGSASLLTSQVELWGGHSEAWPLLLVAVAGRGGGLGEGVLERVEVVVLGDGVATDGHEAVFRALLGVLVDQAARVDGGHVGAVKGGDFLELALVGVAAVLGEAGGIVSGEETVL